MSYSTREEIHYMWWDEWFHIQGIERMQDHQTMELIHPAYTALYIHTSYFLSALLSKETVISLSEFVQGSLLASSLITQLNIVLFYFFINHFTKNRAFALLCAVLFGTQRWVIFHSAVIHPEPPMLLGITLALIGSTYFFLEGKTKMLILASIGCAMAIASKPQAILVLPSCAGVMMYGFAIHKIAFTEALKKIAYGIVVLIFSLFVLTPYQMFHLDKLIAGIQGEREVQTVVENSQIWNWIKYLVSNEYLGAFYLTILFFGGLLYFFERNKMSPVYRAIWVNSLFYVVFGVLYIVLQVNNLIARYLLHTLPALALLIGICYLLLMKHQYQRGNLLIKVLISLILIGGIQQQIKHAKLSFSGREKALDEIQQIHQFTTELEQIVGTDENMAGLNFRFLRKTHFEFTEKYNIFDVQKYRYVILNTHYTGYWEGSKQKKNEEVLRFQKILETMNQRLLSHSYKLIKDYFHGKIQVYQMKKIKNH